MCRNGFCYTVDLSGFLLCVCLDACVDVFDQGGNIQSVGAGPFPDGLKLGGLIVYGDSVSAGNNVEAHISGEGNVFYLDRVEAGKDIIARLGAGDILYGGDLNAGGRVSTLTGNGTVSAGKDLEDDIKADEGRVVYYERHDLIRDGKKSGSAASSGKNAKADQIKVAKPGGKMK